jgi:hypothetical protein
MEILCTSERRGYARPLTGPSVNRDRTWKDAAMATVVQRFCDEMV